MGSGWHSGGHQAKNLRSRPTSGTKLGQDFCPVSASSLRLRLAVIKLHRLNYQDDSIAETTALLTTAHLAADVYFIYAQNAPFNYCELSGIMCPLVVIIQRLVVVMEFDTGERAYLNEMRMLSTDNAGNEVVVGLTVEESKEYYGYTRLQSFLNAVRCIL
jgi:hypothetical protein